MYCNTSTGDPTSSSNEGRFNGWNPGPDTRGTMDIILTCIMTTILCTYSMLCLNRPANGETWWEIHARKIVIMGVAISGPEFILTAAIGQLAAARDSVRHFKSKYPWWTYQHAFFADMGGFELHAKDFPPFPVNSKHLSWLLRNDYIAMPKIPYDELSEKSKEDTLAKVLTCLQAGYFLIQVAGRAAQGLALTSIELSTFATVVCAIMTSLFWMPKPNGICLPVIISTEVTISQMLADVGIDIDYPYRQTPLDFIDDLTPSWAINVHPVLFGPVTSFKRPIQRFGDSRLPDLTWTENLGLCVLTMVYSSIHLFGWKFAFPSKIENVLWRSSSLILVGTTFLFWVLESLAIHHRHIIQSRERHPTLSARHAFLQPNGIPMSSIAVDREDLENAQGTTYKPRTFPLLWEYWSIFFVGIFYAFARCYILVESLMGLRVLPCSAYRMVEWTRFIPHF